MGLTIFWNFDLPASEATRLPPAEGVELLEIPPIDPPDVSPGPRDVLTALRQRCLDLPFDYVSDLVHLTHEPTRGGHNRNLWIAADPYHLVADGNRIRVTPTEVLGFTVDPGEGADAAEFFLARYPRTTWDGQKRVDTGLTGWHSHGACKTQYASISSEEHFVRCHGAVISALDAARELGVLTRIRDEGMFADLRDDNALKAELRDWNAMVAALSGKFKDMAKAGEIQSPIFKNAQFERLEMEGQQKTQGFGPLFD